MNKKILKLFTLVFALIGALVVTSANTFAATTSRFGFKSVGENKIQITFDGKEQIPLNMDEWIGTNDFSVDLKDYDPGMYNATW